MEVEHFSTKIFSYHNKHDHLLWNPLNIHKWIDCVVLDDKLHWCHSRGCLCSMDYGLYQQIHLSKGHKINLYENTMTPLVFTDLLAHQWKCDWKQLWPWLRCCSGPGLKNAAPPCHLPTTTHQEIFWWLERSPSPRKTSEAYVELPIPSNVLGKAY